MLLIPTPGTHAHVKPQSKTPPSADTPSADAPPPTAATPVANGNGSSNHTDAEADQSAGVAEPAAAADTGVSAAVKSSNPLPAWIPGDAMLAAACGIPAFDPVESCPEDVTTYLEQIIIAVSNWCQVGDAPSCILKCRRLCTKSCAGCCIVVISTSVTFRGEIDCALSLWAMFQPGQISGLISVCRLGCRDQVMLADPIAVPQRRQALLIKSREQVHLTRLGMYAYIQVFTYTFTHYSTQTYASAP